MQVWKHESVANSTFGKNFFLCSLLLRRSLSLSYSESTRKMPKVPNFAPQAARHVWIHTALIEKVLDKIVLYLVENSRWERWDSDIKRKRVCVVFRHNQHRLSFSSYCPYCFSKFYEKEAILMDPVDGPILASLLGTLDFFFIIFILKVTVHPKVKILMSFTRPQLHSYRFGVNDDRLFCFGLSI